MKKIFIILLSLLLVLNYSTITFAGKNQSLNKNELYSDVVPESNFISDPSVNISEIFGISDLQMKDLAKGSKIEYNFDIEEIDDKVSYVKIKGEYYLDDETYTFETEGEVDSITIGKRTLLNGSTDGFMLVDNNKVDLIIHFQHYKDEGESFITMSLFDPIKEVNGFLAFGGKIVTDEFRNKIEKDFEERENTLKKFVPNDKTDSSTSGLSFDFIVGTGRSGVYVDLYKSGYWDPQVLKLEVNSNTTGIKRMLDALYVESYAVEGRITTDDRSFKITGTDPGTSPSSRALLIDLLDYVFDMANIPFRVLEDILISTMNRGSIEVYGPSMYDKSILIETSSRFNFDYNDFPLLFGIDTGRDSTARGDYQATVKYMYYDWNERNYYYTAKTPSKQFSTRM